MFMKLQHKMQLTVKSVSDSVFSLIWIIYKHEPIYPGAETTQYDEICRQQIHDIV